jgi:hypothetical protein
MEMSGITRLPSPGCRRSARFRGGEVDEAVELFAREGVPLGGRLHLDQPAVAAHDDVHVHVRGRVLAVVQVEERLAADDPNEIAPTRSIGAGSPCASRRGERDPGAADRGRPCPAVRLDDVASRARSCARRASRGRRPARRERPTRRWISTCGRPGGRRGLARACARRSRREASRTRRHPAASAPDEPSGARPPRSSRCRARASSRRRSAPSRPPARRSPGRRRWDGARPARRPSPHQAAASSRSRIATCSTLGEGKLEEALPERAELVPPAPSSGSASAPRGPGRSRSFFAPASRPPRARSRLRRRSASSSGRRRARRPA